MNKLLCALAFGIAAATLAGPAMAWPDKPVTIIVPFPPGGSTDMIGRTLAGKMQSTLGGNFLVDNRAGATGTIGSAAVKRSPPDGYTLLVTSLGPLVITPHLIKGLPYDPLKDFDYITVAVQAPNVLVVPANSPHKSVADVIAFHKANPGKMTFASAGNGSSDHLTAALFWQQTGTTGLHIPYKGGAPALTDLLGGQVDATFLNINTGISHIKSGKLKALAVTGARRAEILPDVPTMAEAGVKDLVVYSWQALAAPRGLPADIKAKLRSAAVEALKDPQIKPKLLEIGFEIVANTPEQFTAFQANEFARWKKVIEIGKITAD